MLVHTRPVWLAVSRMKRIVTYVHHYKRLPPKKPKGPSIETPVVQAKAPGTKATAATKRTPDIVTSISRHDAARKRAWDPVERRDHDADTAITARMRAYVYWFRSTQTTSTPPRAAAVTIPMLDPRHKTTAVPHPRSPYTNLTFDIFDLDDLAL